MSERLYESTDPTDRRWSVVVAYYSVLHGAHAIAARRWDEHPDSHLEVIDLPLRIDPNRTGLKAQIQELLELSMNARYLKGSASSAARWYEPYFVTEEDALDRAISLMRQLTAELRRIS
jgi:hypothetical protein